MPQVHSPAGQMEGPGSTYKASDRQGSLKIPRNIAILKEEWKQQSGPKIQKRGHGEGGGGIQWDQENYGMGIC